MDREKIIEGLRDIDMFIAGRLGHEKAKNFLRTIDETIALLKEQEGTINELQNAYGYLQKQFFEAQDKLLKEHEAQKFFVDESGKITPLPVVVRCKDCKHRPKEPDFETYESGFDLEFPEGSKCPCRCCGDDWYSWYPADEWFCADGERVGT